MAESKNGAWKITLPVAITLMLAIIAGAMAYGALRSDVAHNCDGIKEGKVERKEMKEETSTVLIQMGRMDQKMQGIEQATQRIEEKLDKMGHP